MPSNPLPRYREPPARPGAQAVHSPLRCGLLLVVLLAALLAGCQPLAAAAPPTPSSLAASSPGPTPDDGLTEAQRATLASLQRVDDHPLYVMDYQGAYDPPHIWPPREAPGAARLPSLAQEPSPDWGCALFAALGDPQRPVYGRNFDWRPSPALLLFTHPPGGYASASMVDLEYFDFQPGELANLEALPLPAREALLRTPRMPFDGMNSAGLVVGMAAVPPGNMTPYPQRPTIGSLGILRLLLDQAADVPQALEILGSYNLEFGGGPPLHYLLADRHGTSALVEFYQGEAHLFYNERPWQQATNFLLSSVRGADAVADAGADHAVFGAAGQCWRYDRLEAGLSSAGGVLDAARALDLLGQVAQDNTQWSVVYAPAQGEVYVQLGSAGQAGQTHSFQLESLPQ